MIKYVLHSGFVRSRNDGDIHWIPGYKLAQLYRLKPGSYFIWKDNTPYSTTLPHIDLYPDPTGVYSLERL
jgi:hypothetical protein